MSKTDIRIPVFFDFGGTIADTVGIVQAVFKQSINKEMSREEIIQMYKDASKKGISMKLFFKYPVNPIKLLSKRKMIRTLQRELFISEIKLQEGITELLEKIQKIEGLQMILVTQNPLFENEEASAEILEKLFGDKVPFEQVLAGEDKMTVINENFDSDIVLSGILIGDLPNDIQAADFLNIPCIGVTWGYSSENELDTPYIADTFDDLYELIQDHVDDIKEDRARLHKDEDEIEFTEDVEFEDY